MRGGRNVATAGLRCARGVPSPARSAAALIAGAALLVSASGCGGGSRADAGEPAGTYRMRLVRASFPTLQAVARPTRLVVQVRNTSLKTVPNIAVSIDSFSYTSTAPEVSASKRPIWAIERGPGAIAVLPVETQEVAQPGGAQTAYLNTWALGPLAPGHVATFIWQVVPVKPGLHTVHVTVAAGLAGKSKAALVSGAAVVKTFKVLVAGVPPRTHVDPNTGLIVPGPYNPSSPGSR